jgi:8-oxo-dGTP pyrophosphatase MutT (NUDIX family)
MGNEGDATAVDRLIQLGYRSAYRLMRAYWMVRHPTTHGALVALWNGGEVLLVKNSYVPYYSMPGGYVQRGESSRAAALRELKEEVGVSARADDLELVVDVTHEWEGKHDHVEVFSLDVSPRPEVRVDRREVVEATWVKPERALTLNLFPPLKQVIERRLAG